MNNFSTTQNTNASLSKFRPLEVESVMNDLLLTRRSIRNFLRQPVPLELVDELLRLALRAPSAHNRQPWRWVVVHTSEAKQQLAQEMGRDFRRDLLADGVAAEKVERMVARSHERIGGAPVLVIPCLTMEEMDRYPDPERQRCEWQMAVQSVALACQNLMLAAHARGLGSCWICAPIFCVPTVQRALDLPPDWEPQGLITLGYPADQGRDRVRKPLESVTVYR